MSSRPFTKKHVMLLFVCTGNSCRSQMAEGFGRALGGAKVTVTSAGIVASRLHPLAVKVMAEAGIDISQQTSKELSAKMIDAADIVITVCSNADQQCPAIPKGKKKYHWPIYDPVSFEGDPSTRLDMFRVVRDEIREHVAALLGEHTLLDEAAAADRIRKGSRA